MPSSSKYSCSSASNEDGGDADGPICVWFVCFVAQHVKWYEQREVEVRLPRQQGVVRWDGK